MAAYEIWDANADNPLAANFVATHIKQLIYDVGPAYPNVKYIVVVGDDRVIPHYRIQDENFYSNEAGYAKTAATPLLQAAAARPTRLAPPAAA